MDNRIAVHWLRGAAMDLHSSRAKWTSSEPDEGAHAASPEETDEVELLSAPIAAAS